MGNIKCFSKKNCYFLEKREEEKEESPERIGTNSDRWSEFGIHL
jgi:hypothetical protein